MPAPDCADAMALLEHELVELVEKVEEEARLWATMSLEERGEGNLRKMENLGLLTASDRAFFLKDIDANEAAYTIGAMSHEFKRRVIDAMSKRDKVTNYQPIHQRH